MKKEAVKKILEEIEQGYDSIADKFSETRKHFWRDLEFIGDYAKDGDKILDFGCGNGRLLELIGDKRIEYVGADVSGELLALARAKYSRPGVDFRKISGSGTLPFPDNYFNKIYSVAVLHHLPDAGNRQAVAKELQRVLRPGGRIVVTVWNLWPACSASLASNDAVISGRRSNAGRQKKYFGHILKNWIDKVLGKSDLDWNDCYVSFKDNHGRIFQRYHHGFRLGEIRDVFRMAGFSIERSGVVNGRNLIVVGRKF